MDFNSLQDLDGLGMRRRFGGGGGGGGPIEGFETGPLGGTLTWQDDTYRDGGTMPADNTVTSSALHVTEGTKSWKITGTYSGSQYPGIETASPVDISMYTTISADVYAVDLGVDGEVAFALYSDDGSAFEADGTLALGSSTLTVSVSDFVTAGGDASQAYMLFYASTAEADTVEFHVDNIRGA